MIKVSCVSYLNSQPFIDGLRNHPIREEIILSLDIPSVCADKLKSGEVDIGLVPIVLIPELKESHIISDYCIGADGKVETVLMVSDVSLEKIDTILLDNQSRTSVILAKILAEKSWKIHPHWVDYSGDFTEMVKGATAGVLIGDKTFQLAGKYRYTLDLAEEWKKLTTSQALREGLPFVFAGWVANKALPPDFIQEFNQALEAGLAGRKRIAEQLSGEYPGVDVSDYLLKKISYNLDDKKRQAMDLFLKYAQELNSFEKR